MAKAGDGVSELGRMMIIRRSFLASCVIVALAGSAVARSPSVSTERDLSNHRHYRNVGGHIVHSPSKTISGHRPAGATAHCRDGSWSFSEHSRGTCSHHGGVG